MRNEAVSGMVEYTGRAFLQDAQEAMGGDIIRALIEMITNCDDSYGSSKGKIRIEIEHCRGHTWRVIVRDRAKGMRAKRMREAIAKIAGRTSGFEVGKNVRGNLGRGAKDLAAFGVVVFESICDGRYSKLSLKQTGNYDLDSERDATNQIRAELHIPKGSGTVVTIYVNKNFRCPQHNKLLDTLSRHYQLRDILSDSNRDIQLAQIGKKGTDTLRYTPPDLPVVFQGELSIEGYPEAVAKIIISRNPERYDDPSSDTGRPAGLLVKGRRAIYENPLFKFESNPHAGWFSGKVVCTYIDQLAEEYDNRLSTQSPQQEQNPVPIITRRRDGLQKAHPFYKKLVTVIEGPLGVLIEQEEKKAREKGAHETARMRRSLNSLGKELARMINDDMRELDEDDLIKTGHGRDQIPSIRLIPEHPVLYVGEDKTVTVQVLEDSGVDVTNAELEPGGVVECRDEMPIKLSPHRKRSDVLTGQIHLRPLTENQETLLTVTYGEHQAVGLIEVRPERIDVEEEIEEPESFEFERELYRVGWMKKKRIRLVAPAEVVAQEGIDVNITSNDAGVVIRRSVQSLEFDEELEYYATTVELEPRTLDASATIYAKLGEVAATCKVIVAKDEEGPGLKINIVDKEADHRRALVERDGKLTVINIMGRHPAIKRYVGPGPEFLGQERSVSKALIAEIIAGEATRMVMERKFASDTNAGLLDAANMYYDHSKFLSRYLTRCHKLLQSDADLVSLSIVSKKPSGSAGTSKAESNLQGKLAIGG